jgi:hypothetical protein
MSHKGLWRSVWDSFKACETVENNLESGFGLIKIMFVLDKNCFGTPLNGF